MHNVYLIGNKEYSLVTIDLAQGHFLLSNASSQIKKPFPMFP